MQIFQTLQHILNVEPQRSSIIFDTNPIECLARPFSKPIFPFNFMWPLLTNFIEPKLHLRCQLFKSVDCDVSQLDLVFNISYVIQLLYLCHLPTCTISPATLWHTSSAGSATELSTILL